MQRVIIYQTLSSLVEIPDDVNIKDSEAVERYLDENNCWPNLIDCEPVDRLEVYPVEETS